MSKYTKLCNLYDSLERELCNIEYNVTILMNVEENHLSVIYDGHRVCTIKDCYDNDRTYHIVFEDGFFNGVCLPAIRRCENIKDITSYIAFRISHYIRNKGQEVKNMAKRHFIVEKMEVEQRCCESDVINMTVRKEPDGILPFQTGRELKTLIESLDPDKLSSDYRINVNVDNDTIAKQIYMMTARGNGKTRWISEMLKNKSVIYNGNIYNDIKDVIFNDPATIVFWLDGTKTVVKCQPGETFDPEKGLAMAISKKVLGNDYGYYETFAKYVGRYNKKRFNKALEEAKKVTPDEVVYNGRTYVLKDVVTVHKEK